MRASGMPHLDGDDGGVAGAFDGGERADARRESSRGCRDSFSVSSVMMPSVPSEPIEEAR